MDIMFISGEGLPARHKKLFMITTPINQFLIEWIDFDISANFSA